MRFNVELFKGIGRRALSVIIGKPHIIVDAVQREIVHLSPHSIYSRADASGHSKEVLLTCLYGRSARCE